MAQASASKIRRRVREREGVARFIARDFEGSHLYGVRLTHIIQGRACFDVHAAREAAEALVKLEAEQAVFEDWTRERGLGPENREPSAFVAPARETSVQVAGAGPGAYVINLGGSDVGIHVNAPSTNEDIARSLAVALSEQHPDHGATADGPVVTFGRKRSGGWPGKLAREYAVSHRGRDPRAPMGRALARLGRRVLAAIEGQPSECQAQGCPFAVTSRPPTPCPDCNGTGHNLRGTIPALEWPAEVRSKVYDAIEASDNDAPPSWAESLYEEHGADMDRLRTRVVPRGEHRIGPARGKDDPPWTLDQRINGRGWAPESKREAAEDMRLIFACSPAWRRGEVRAFETRRRRAWEAVGVPWEGQLWMPPRAAAGSEAAE